MMSTNEGSGSSDMTAALRVIRFRFLGLSLGFRVQGSGLLLRNLIEVTILGKPY